jgi:excisionase family DNA binding protein
MLSTAIEPDLLTIRQAGERLGVSRQVIYRLVGAGELVLVHVGVTSAASRITVASIEAYLRKIGAGG